MWLCLKKVEVKTYVCVCWMDTKGILEWKKGDLVNLLIGGLLTWNYYVPRHVYCIIYTAYPYIDR